MNETSRAKRLIKLLERLLKKRELYDEDKLKLIKEFNFTTTFSCKGLVYIRSDNSLLMFAEYGIYLIMVAIHYGDSILVQKKMEENERFGSSVSFNQYWI